MKTTLFLTGALLMQGPVMLSAQPSLDGVSAARAEVEADETAVGRAIAARDYEALKKYWSPGLIVNSPYNKISGRADVVASMQHGGLNYASLRGVTEYFTVIGGVAIQMSHENVVMATGPMAGKKLVRRSTDVLQRLKDGWVLIARQATYVGFDGAILAGPDSAAYTQLPATPETASIRVQIDANNRAVGHAIATRDFATLEKLWSPQMVVNSPGNNILTRAQVFAAIISDKLAYSSVKAKTDAFAVSQNIAIEMGHEDIVMSNGPMAGKPLQRRFTDIWQQTDSGWVQIARQATYVGIDGGAVYGHPDQTINQ